MSPTVELHFSYKLLVQKFLKFLIDFDCLSENVSISGLSDYQKLVNVCVERNNDLYKKHKYYLTSGCQSNVKFLHFAIKFKIENFELKVHLIR